MVETCEGNRYLCDVGLGLGLGLGPVRGTAICAMSLMFLMAKVMFLPQCYLV